MGYEYGLMHEEPGTPVAWTPPRPESPFHKILTKIEKIKRSFSTTSYLRLPDLLESPRVVPRTQNKHGEKGLHFLNCMHCMLILQDALAVPLDVLSGIARTSQGLMHTVDSIS